MKWPDMMLRGVGVGAIVAMVGVYYGQGLTIQVWPDSGGYLVQGLGLAGLEPYARPGDRGVGYPLMLALALKTPWPGLALVVVQLVLAVVAFVAVYLALSCWVVPGLALSERVARRVRDGVVAGLAAASLYSVLHVQIAAMLTEILFCTLALLAVLGVAGLVLRGGGWLRAVLVSVLVGLPLLVKPHWQIAALFLGIVISLSLLVPAAVPFTKTGVPRSLVWSVTRLLPALILPAGVILAVGLPDRLLASRYSNTAHTLFGPRAAFCNHAHMIRRTLRDQPNLKLQGELKFESDLRGELDRIVASHTGGWRLLGFNGDLCSYSRELTDTLDRRFPEPEAQARFLLGSLVRAALADPVPYAAKVALQLGAGFTTAFTRFAIHPRPGVAAYTQLAAVHSLGPEFLAGVRLAGEFGPLGTREAFKASWRGKLLQGGLAAIFFGLTGLLVGLAVVSLVAPWRRWRAWPDDRRRLFLAVVATPLGVLLSHHALIALVHTFDVWRYGFNMFFVNLFFIGSAGMFWWRDWSERRAGRSDQVRRHGHFTTGGSDDRIELTLPPVFRPKTVPRSCSRLNST